MNLLIAAATAGEIAPFLAHMRPYRVAEQENGYIRGLLHMHICITGVGSPATAYALTKALSSSSYDLAVQAGIAGSFSPEAPIGSVWKIKSEMLADLGAENKDGAFMDLFEMGLLEKDQFPFKAKQLKAPDLPYPLLPQIPETNAITVHTVTGSADTICKRTDRYHPSLESMEGAAFHYVCLMEKIPFLQIRSISNRVAVRDKSQWNIPLAVTRLNNTLIQLTDQLPLH